MLHKSMIQIAASIGAILLFLHPPKSIAADGLKPRIKFASPFARLKPKQLAGLLSNGEISWTQSYRNGTLKQASVMSLVAATPDRVWRALTSYESHVRLLPSLVTNKIIRRRKNRVVVAMEFEVPGSNTEYTVEHRHFPFSRIDSSVLTDGDLELGEWRWQLLPYNKGRQTILIYHLYTRQPDAGWMKRNAAGGERKSEYTLNLSSGLEYVLAIKRRAESLSSHSSSTE